MLGPLLPGLLLLLLLCVYLYVSLVIKYHVHFF